MTKPLSPALRLRVIQTPPTWSTIRARRAQVQDCVEQLRVALRVKAQDQAHANVPYPDFRLWLAGHGYERLTNPAFHALRALVGADAAQARFTAVAASVLLERETHTVCDSCQQPVALIVCEIDAAECVTCPRCAAVEVDARLRAWGVDERKVA